MRINSVEREKVRGHPSDVRNCISMLTYCSDKGFRCKRNKYLGVIGIEVMN